MRASWGPPARLPRAARGGRGGRAHASRERSELTMRVWLVVLVNAIPPSHVCFRCVTSTFFLQLETVVVHRRLICCAKVHSSVEGRSLLDAASAELCPGWERDRIGALFRSQKGAFAQGKSTFPPIVAAHLGACPATAPAGAPAPDHRVLPTPRECSWSCAADKRAP